MAEDLRNYNLQLQQVEAALLTDPQNEELLKLKGDLEEVIELTQDLIKTQEGESKSSNIHGSSNDDDVTASLLAAEEEADQAPTQWQVGDKCLAKWKLDGMPQGHFYMSESTGISQETTVEKKRRKKLKFYDATIEEITVDSYKVKFEGWNSTETVSVYDVKSVSSGLKRRLSTDESKHGKPGYNREYLKKKKQKKQQRFKQIEEERESEKNKWLSFHTKASKKPGVRTKSIFASPDNLTGRVGIGTCGISGQPMTNYTPGEKWKKGG